MFEDRHKTKYVHEMKNQKTVSGVQVKYRQYKTEHVMTQDILW